MNPKTFLSDNIKIHKSWSIFSPTSTIQKYVRYHFQSFSSTQRGWGCTAGLHVALNLNSTLVICSPSVKHCFWVFFFLCRPCQCKWSLSLYIPPLQLVHRNILSCACSNPMCGSLCLHNDGIRPTRWITEERGLQPSLRILVWFPEYTQWKERTLSHRESSDLLPQPTSSPQPLTSPPTSKTSTIPTLLFPRKSLTIFFTYSISMGYKILNIFLIFCSELRDSNDWMKMSWF